jgi:hypothetical protein
MKFIYNSKVSYFDFGNALANKNIGFSLMGVGLLLIDDPIHLFF